MSCIASVVSRALIAACGKLPAGKRRLIFVASLAGNVKQANTLDKQTIRKLNSLMRLCDTESSIGLPVHLREVIWRGVSVDDLSKYFTSPEVLSETTVREAIERFVAKVPRWLQYNEMAEDLHKLLVHRAEVFG